MCKLCNKTLSDSLHLAKVYLCSTTVCVNVLLQGYQGLVDGGDHIRLATWESVSMMLQLVSYVQPRSDVH